MRSTKNFASDNNAGVHPDILKAMVDANSGYALAYGADSYTEAAVRKFKEHFGPEIDVYLVFNGTGANVLGLKTVTDSYHGVICTEMAHINVDEGGAPEKFSGCKLITLPSPDGKLSIAQVAAKLEALGNQHHNQPKVISITQSTELGTVYSRAEIQEIADFAHQHGLYLHMDGARIANAAAALNVGLAEITGAAGVDVLSFGGTKNGLMLGEAVVFFNPELSPNFKYIRKQGMQLASKMRFLAVQFETLLSNNLWLQNAQNANQMAQLLASELTKLGIRITQKVEANVVFAELPPQRIKLIQEQYYFYLWNEETYEARLMCSFDTTPDDVMGLVRAIGNC